MSKSSVPPSERSAKEIQALLNGECKEGESLLSNFLRAGIQKIVHEILEQEVSAFLGRGWYERGRDNPDDESQSRPWRNGYKERTLRTAEGLIPVQVPQVRNTREPYRSELWPHLKGNSDELNRLVTELYARGLSTRDIEQVFKDPQTGRKLLSRSQVSAITDALNEEYAAFAKRSLSGFDVVYLFVDAVYEPLRRVGRTREAILCSWGILSDGSKVLLHMDVAGSESYSAWKAFLVDLVRRGLPAPLTVTTDGSPGAIRAVEEVWSDAIRIRCWVHKMQNVLDKVPKEAHGDVKAFLTSIRDAPNWATGKQLAEQFIETYRREYPRAVAAFEDDLEASLAHLQLPAIHRRSIRTTNLVERSFTEERRRTKVIPGFTSEESGLKLIFATLWRVSESWRGVRFTEHEQRQIAHWRARIRAAQQSETHLDDGNEDQRITA
mgnify:CR=1 FL=1